MIEGVIYEIMNGNANIVDWYTRARVEWSKIIEEGEENPQVNLPGLIERRQQNFESITGNRHEGKILMGISSVVIHYNPQFGFANVRLAHKYFSALTRATVSMEVASAARGAAKECGLLELFKSEGLA